MADLASTRRPMEIALAARGSSENPSLSRDNDSKLKNMAAVYQAYNVHAPDWFRHIKDRNSPTPDMKAEWILGSLEQSDIYLKQTIIAIKKGLFQPKNSEFYKNAFKGLSVLRGLSHVFDRVKTQFGDAFSSHSDENLNEIKTNVIAALRRYTLKVEFKFYSLFGHHHGKRMQHVIASIDRASSTEEIERILNWQYSLMTEKTVDFSKAPTISQENRRWINQLPRHRATESAIEKSGYLKAILHALQQIDFDTPERFAGFTRK